MPSDGHPALSRAGEPTAGPARGISSEQRAPALWGQSFWGRRELSGISTHSSPNPQERFLFFPFPPDSSNVRGNGSEPGISTAGAQNPHNFIPKVLTLAKVFKSALKAEH